MRVSLFALPLVFLLGACGAAKLTEAPKEVEPIIYTPGKSVSFNQDPNSYFLLKSDGSPFKDAAGKEAKIITAGEYTTKLNVSALTFTATGENLTPEDKAPRYALRLVLKPVATNHALSSDAQSVFLDVDGKGLQFPFDYDFTTFRDSTGKQENIDVELKPQGIKKILAAKEVALKVRLFSEPMATAGECATAVAGSAKLLSCKNPYTGQKLTGKNLQSLQAFVSGK
ncbi:MAG: hypothetical protein WCA07_12650 [Gloeobacterales cyanobacterium]